jgi:tetratricopeptide (TPR) repeat protein
MLEKVNIFKVKFLLLALCLPHLCGFCGFGAKWHLGLDLYAQSWRRDVRKGNEYYEKKNFKEAEKKYKQAQEKKPDNFDANFNLADAYYKQKKYDESAAIFNSLKDKTTNKDKLSSLYHNLGNSYLKNKKYEESINSFKQSLKLKPQDKDTKYNLAYANAMLQKQQEQKQQNKDKDKDDKNKDNKDKQNGQGEKGKDKEKANEPKKGENDGEKNQKPEDGKMSKEQAEQLLKAIQGKEKDVQDKLKAQRARGAKVKVEKDW